MDSYPRERLLRPGFKLGGFGPHMRSESTKVGTQSSRYAMTAASRSVNIALRGFPGQRA